MRMFVVFAAVIIGCASQATAGEERTWERSRNREVTRCDGERCRTFSLERSDRTNRERKITRKRNRQTRRATCGAED
ncbi:MAG: hypothetical protein CMM47_00895 [Rhodospirillaceae bacterium]|nr:hypothetical protein [Rhodospirillaceae bacterium]